VLKITFKFSIGNINWEYMLRKNRKREKVLNKVRRTTVIVFFKKILPLIIFLILFSLSIILGFWNVRTFEYEGLTNVSKVELDSYLEEFKNENIFLLSPQQIQKKIIDSNGFIENVYVKKVMPSKVVVRVDEYIPYYIGYSSDICILFSKGGFAIKRLCEECEDTCFEDQEFSLVNIKSDQNLESNRELIFYEEFDSLLTLFGEFGYTITEINMKEGIVEIIDIENHLFIFDITYDLETQLARWYLVAKKIDNDMIQFDSIDMRFERPVMELK